MTRVRGSPATKWDRHQLGSVQEKRLAKPDHPVTRADQAAQPVGRFASDVNRCEPAGAGALCQAFGVGFAWPCRQALADVEAGARQARTCHPALRPDRKHTVFDHAPARVRQPVAKSACDGFRIGGTSAARSGMPSLPTTQIAFATCNTSKMAQRSLGRSSHGNCS